MNDKHRGGRPRELTQQQADKLLQRITDGDSLASIVEGDEWQSYRTIFRRIEDDENFDDGMTSHGLFKLNAGRTS
jgi:transposase